MPTYEYECSSCGYNFEVSQNMTAKPIKICPKCKGQVKRLIGAGAGIIFKGSGFYSTDYRKKPKIEAPKEKCSTCPQIKEGCQMKPKLTE